MGLDYQLIRGQTPLDDEEKEGLLISSITTREELDEHEQQNIQEAIRWMLGRKFKREDILTEKFIKKLHQKMYGDVWKWAGAFRKTNKNLGVDRFQISMELQKLLDDCKFWIENNTFPPDEIAVRFKHRIVFIHCFPNGNGRHSRMMADLIVEHIFGSEVFSWGTGGNLIMDGTARDNYIKAIKAADNNNITPLLEFSRA
ncbi:MAG TPA: mobile mystery protein B [Cyclobacteriaceae bacterium]|nr:mobile mystery protein B [Cyclobacteriaceae bacterium]